MKLRVALSALLLSVGLTTSALAQTGSKAPDFKLQTADKKEVSISALKGKVVLVNFWATWCGPCVREIPDFLEVYQQYRSKGFEIVGISLDRGGWETVTPFVAKMKMTYPVAIGDNALVEAYGGFNAIPTSFLIDRKGVVVKQVTGTMSKADLEALLKTLL